MTGVDVATFFSDSGHSGSGRDAHKWAAVA
jgi:hypothetical protein